MLAGGGGPIALIAFSLWHASSELESAEAMPAGGSQGPLLRKRDRDKLQLARRSRIVHERQRCLQRVAADRAEEWICKHNHSWLQSGVTSQRGEGK